MQEFDHQPYLGKGGLQVVWGRVWVELWVSSSLLSAVGCTADDRNPAFRIVRNTPYVPEFRVLKVMQEFYHQP